MKQTRLHRKGIIALVTNPPRTSMASYETDSDMLEAATIVASVVTWSPWCCAALRQERLLGAETLLSHPSACNSAAAASSWP